MHVAKRNLRTTYLCLEKPYLELRLSSYSKAQDEFKVDSATYPYLRRADGPTTYGETFFECRQLAS